MDNMDNKEFVQKRDNKSYAVLKKVAGENLANLGELRLLPVIQKPYANLTNTY